MSDRITIATTVFIAGIMFGAFTVQLKDQLSLHLGTLGFKNNHAMLGDGTIKARSFSKLRSALLTASRPAGRCGPAPERRRKA
jgi:hypothetical protein